jgi:enoyl-CoA hydratase/carnithine racemase
VDNGDKLNLTTLKYEKKDRIAFINLTTRINETELALAFAAELSDVCSDIHLDKEIRATLLFCGEKNALSVDDDIIENGQAKCKEVMKRSSPLPSLSQDSTGQ